MLNRLLMTTAALVCGLAAPSAQAQTFDGVVVFGDSLSDGGNVSDLASLPRARFTTNPGLTTIEYVAQSYGLALEPSRLGGTNFAYGGAGFTIFGVPDLTTQADTYLAAHAQVDPNALFFVWGGGNDVFAHGGETPSVAQAGLENAAQIESNLLDTLQAAGAANIVVANVPDIGLTVGGTPNDTALVTIFNDKLNTELAGRTGIIPVNAFGLLREIAANPTAFGYTDVTTPACTVGSSLFCTPSTLVSPDAAQTHLFADNIHPTTAAHTALAQVIVGEIAAPDRVSVLSLAPLAVLRGHMAAVASEAQRVSVSGGRVFLDAGAGRRNFDGGDASPNAKSNDNRITFGGVWRSDGPFSFGGALSYGSADLRVDGGLSAVDADTFFGSGFARADWDNGVWASVQLGYGVTDYNHIRRRVAYGSAVRIETADSSGEDIGAELAAGRRFDLGTLRVGAFASLTYERAHMDNFAESSGDATAMRFGTQTRDSDIGRLGLDLDGSVALGGITLRPNMRAAYAHNMNDDDTIVRAGLTTMNGEFDTLGFDDARSWGEVALGLDVDLAHDVVAHVSYQTSFGGRIDDNAATANIAWRF